MRRALRLTLLAATSFACAATALWMGRDARRNTAFASDPSAVPPAPIARLVLGHGEVDGFSTEVAIATIDPAKNVATLTPIGSVAHPRGSAIRGAVFGNVAFVTARTEAPRSTTYDSALYRVEAGTVTKLCDGIERATTPWVTSTGRVIVARGVDGKDPPASEAQKLVLRTDELTIDDVDPATGAVRTLWRGQGYQAFLGARLGDDRLVVSLSQKSGASLFALDPATGATKPLASIPTMARDFSFDRVHGRVVFATLGAGWEIAALDLASGALRTLYASANEHQMPFALPSGDVAFSSDGDKGLALLSSTSQLRLLSPLGDGSDAITHVDGRWAALRHTPATQTNDDPPRVVAFDTGGGKVVSLGVPSSHFVEPFGFASPVGGAK